MRYQFRENTHPEANGRVGKQGEWEYTLTVALEYDATLFVKLGHRGMIRLAALVALMLDDNEATMKAIEAEIDELREEMGGDE